MKPIVSITSSTTTARVSSMTTITDVLKTTKLVKFPAMALLSVSLVFLASHSSSSYSSPFYSFSFSYSSPPPLMTPQLSPPPAVRWTGIIDEMGAMSDNFFIGEWDSITTSGFTEISDGNEEGGEEEEEKTKKSDGKVVKVWFEKYKVCEGSKVDYIPCLDNEEAIKLFNNSKNGEEYERHCPGKDKTLNCVVPRSEGYRSPIPWPQSRDEVGKTGYPIKRRDKFIFPGGGGTQFICVALDIGSGVASFDPFLLQRNVTTLSIAPKDAHGNQIQFALEHGVPAMVAVFATRRLLYPSQAFDLIHCSRCSINWTRDDGILLLEADRILRAGGYFIWAAQPVDKREEILQEQWEEMEDLTTRICWELVKEGYIAIWRKPLNNSCYLNRDTKVLPPLCDPDDNSDNVWDANLRVCITPFPQNGYGSNVTTWPARLPYPPERLQTIETDAYISRKEIFRAESKYWNESIYNYVRAYHWKEMKLRNVMDMRAGLGGFAAALHNFQIYCWVMNVVPVSGFNTLPVIYDRGVIGVMHDWCNISTIMLEMDRILRPGGRVYIRDSVSIMSELEEIATALGWVCALHETGEGPHASWKVLISEKRM